ncbi:acetoin utilization protein AcuC [Janibacter sp. G56]|uniref:acetoin utilization protein AcuC n=1 Tax=Janibacter sp. G56 TaxID=3418717 RepID=UPI003CFFEF83
MVSRTSVVWGADFLKYNFGPGHPMAPLRLDLTQRLCSALGILDDVDVIDPALPSNAYLTQLHDPAFVAAVRAASEDPGVADAAFGLGTEDVPAFLGMHEASARIVGGTLESCRRVASGQNLHSVNFTGGMHHAMPGRAGGFCVYNDIAAGIRELLDSGFERVAYIDIDVHHGDGVEAYFWDDPRVLTASMHENGRALYPGTGWPTEVGGSGAEGSVVNVALPPGVRDSAWLRALSASIVPAVRAFKPQVIVSQHGCDSHSQDPLAHLQISVDGQRAAADVIHRLSHEVSDGRWVAVGGGGYELVSVVPRVWAHLVGIAGHTPVSPATSIPQEWLDHVETHLGKEGPATMGELAEGDLPIWVQPWEMGFNPHSEADRAIVATREAVFPHLGLDIWFD